MNEDSEWEIVEEPYFDKENNNLVHLTAIKNDCDFLLMSVGTNREKRQTFVARGKFGEFKFEASRWDLGEEKPTDTYIVYTQSFPKTEEGQKDKQLCLEHSKEIESALTKLPVKKPYFHNMPVKKVFFDLGSKWTEEILKSSKDIDENNYAR